MTDLAVFAAAEDSGLFTHAPIALWAEDFSGVKHILDGWRALGVTDLPAYLQAEPARLAQCAQSIRVLDVNRRALEMLGLADLRELVECLPAIIRDDALPLYANELMQLWAGKTAFATQSVNYTRAGRRLDIRLNIGMLPGHEHDWSRALVAIEDITAEEAGKCQLLASDRYARSLFHESPVSLWVEDFSVIKTMLDGLRARGISDFETFVDVHPDFVSQCMMEIHVVDVNQYTLTLFGAPDKESLLRRLADIMREEMRGHFRKQLVELWKGQLRHEREVVNYNFAGEPLNLILRFSVMPGHEHDWSKVLIALTDITARKKAEAYLEYLGKHDVLSGLYNRAFYADELIRLDRKGPFPVSVVMIDLNGMKAVNDEFGHAAGDAVLRRVGEILQQTVDKTGCAARVGGDEFAILLPATNAAGIAPVLADLARITALNNQFNSAAPAINLSIGCATCVAGERVETAIQRADGLMYEAKRAFYVSTPGMDRRK